MLGITKDDKLNFEENLFELAKKASMQLNAIIHLQEYSGKEQEESIINSFIFSNFNYYPLIWSLCFCESSQKDPQKKMSKN